MSRALIALWTAVTIAAGTALGTSGARYWDARVRAQSELATLSRISQQARDLAVLRATAPEWMRQGRPPAGLTPRISAALSAAGLPPTAMSSVSPEAESPLGESDLKARRTRAVLTLAPVTLPQLGGFLAAWRLREPQWTVSSIELAPQTGSGQSGAAAPGADLPLRAVIGLETLFVDQGGGR